MPTIDLGEAMALSDVNEFWAVRGKAIQSYAGLEQSLMGLFAVLAGTSRPIAATIFFKISSSDARNKIISALFKKKFGEQYHLFRNSITKHLRPLDIERNGVVHWNAVNFIENRGEQTVVRIVLKPPTFLTGNLGEETQQMGIPELKNFRAKAEFYASLITAFVAIACEQSEHPEIEEQAQPWLEAFQQHVIFPPPVGHILRQQYEANIGEAASPPAPVIAIS